MGKVIDYGVPEHERIHFGEKPKEKEPKRFELKAEFPFSSELKRMTTVYTDKENEDYALVLIKGAVSLDCPSTPLLLD